jgi:hypothetical protein
VQAISIEIGSLFKVTIGNAIMTEFTWFTESTPIREANMGGGGKFKTTCRFSSNFQGISLFICRNNSLYRIISLLSLNLCYLFREQRSWSRSLSLSRSRSIVKFYDAISICPRPAQGLKINRFENEIRDVARIKIQMYQWLTKHWKLQSD